MLEISRFGLYALSQPKNMRKRLVCLRSHRSVFRPTVRFIEAKATMANASCASIGGKDDNTSEEEL